MAYRILVVEDEPDTREMLAVLLGLEGHRVETAGNGREALNLLADRSYDVILCNFRMPGMDGDGLYRRIDQRCGLQQVFQPLDHFLFPPAK